MVNQVILIGRVGKSESATPASTGKRYCKFSLATTSGYGERKVTAWHNCICFGKTQEAFDKFNRVGAMVYVEGKIQYNTYEKDGVKKTSTSILVDSFQVLVGTKDKETEDSGFKDALDSAKIESYKTKDNTLEMPKPVSLAPTNSSFFDEEIPF